MKIKKLLNIETLVVFGYLYQVSLNMILKFSVNYINIMKDFYPLKNNTK